MKINSVNNMAFKALILKNDNQTKGQKNTIKKILNNPFLTNKLICDLAEKDTDIVITANPDGETVELALSTAVDFLGLPYTPFGENGRRLKTTFAPKQNDKMANRNIYLQSSLFFNHAKKLDLASENNINEAENILNTFM